MVNVVGLVYQWIKGERPQVKKGNDDIVWIKCEKLKDSSSILQLKFKCDGGSHSCLFLKWLLRAAKTFVNLKGEGPAFKQLGLSHSNLILTTGFHSVLTIRHWTEAAVGLTMRYDTESHYMCTLMPFSGYSKRQIILDWSIKYNLALLTQIQSREAFKGHRFASALFTFFFLWILFQLHVSHTKLMVGCL